MVVGGLTNRTDCHEEMVCNQALDMMDVVAKVKNPINPGDHIHVNDVKRLLLLLVTICSVDSSRYPQW